MGSEATACQTGGIRSLTKDKVMAVTPKQSGNPGLMRSMNERAALRLLIADGPMTRMRLAEAAGLSGPTTSQLVKRLVEAGLVAEAGHTSGARGPNAVIYRARTESQLGVALHVRAGRTTAQVVDAVDSPYPLAEMPLSVADDDAAAQLTLAIGAACQAASRTTDEIAAICVGGPGAVSADGDILRLAEDMPGWPSHDVRSQLEAKIGVTVAIENDAKLAAVAEAHAGDPSEDFVLLWQGEGLGVAVMVGGAVYRGASGGAGEIGYVPVSRSAAEIDAEATDLQSLAGAEAVMKVASAAWASITSFAQALAALREGDLRPSLLAQMAPRTAEALIPVVAVLDPARIVLGGPTGLALGDEGARLVQQYLRDFTRWSPPVQVAHSMPDPVLRGAAITLSQYLAERMVSRVT